MSRQPSLLGSFIRAHRQARGLSAAQLARRIGSSDTSILRLENGDVTSPGIGLLRGLAEALGVPPADVFALASLPAGNDLPSLTSYMQARYSQLPKAALRELEDCCDQILGRHTPGALDDSDHEAIQRDAADQETA